MANPFGIRSVDDRIRESIMDSDDIDLGDQTGRKVLITIAYFIAGLLFCVFVWWAFAAYYNEFLAVHITFPTPVECIDRVFEFFTTDFTVLGQDILTHLKYSLSRWIKGFFIAAVIGVIIGAAMGSDDRIYRFGMVPVNILQMVPGLAWYPVCILLFGLGEKSAIFIIAITVISPVAINVCNGLRRVPKVNMRVAQMCGKNRADIFVDVQLPFAAMDFITGFRIGMANAWRMLIAAEMVVGVAVGLGYAIQLETAFLDYTTAFACILIICAVGLIIDKVIFANIESYVSRRLGLGVRQ